MNVEEIRKAVVAAINSPTRPSALYSLAYVKYPLREVQPQLQPDETYIVKLALNGYEYKHRGKKPQNTPSIDTEEIRLFLNALLPFWLYAVTVTYQKTHILICLKKL